MKVSEYRFKSIFNQILRNLYDINVKVKFFDIVIPSSEGARIDAGIFSYRIEDCNSLFYMPDNFNKTPDSFTVYVYDLTGTSVMCFSSTEYSVFKRELENIAVKYENTDRSIFSLLKYYRKFSVYKNIDIELTDYSAVYTEIYSDVKIMPDKIIIDKSYHNRYCNLYREPNEIRLYSRFIDTLLNNQQLLRNIASNVAKNSLYLNADGLEEVAYNGRRFIYLNYIGKAVLNAETGEIITDTNLISSITAKLNLLSIV